MGCGTSVNAPTDRNYAQETRDTLQAQIDLMPQQFKAQSQWAPQFAQLAAETGQAAMPGIMNIANAQQGPMMDMLYQQAQSDLSQGGRLTSDQVRNVQQDTRAAFNDRGLALSNPAMFAEVMNLEGARQNRLQDRQSTAMQVMGQRQQGVSGAMGLMGMGNQSQFNPESGYAQDLYNTNYNGQAAANIATANNRAAMLGGIMSLGGSAIGAGGTIGASVMCWVAREVYGADNPRWLLFREWLFTGAPRWFRALYAGWGDAFAAWIRRKPKLKRRIQRWMDARIATLKEV